MDSVPFGQKSFNETEKDGIRVKTVETGKVKRRQRKIQSIKPIQVEEERKNSVFLLPFSLDFQNSLWYGVVLGKDGEKMTTLENLYYGNIAPHEYEVVRDSEYDITAKLVIRHEQELSATLTEQQNTILQKIKDNHTEMMNLGERDAFVRGFSLAVKLMVDAMSRS